MSIDLIIKKAKMRRLHSYECCKRFPCIPALRNKSEWHRCTFLCSDFTPNLPMILTESYQLSLFGFDYD